MIQILLNSLFLILGVAGLYYGAEFLIKGGVSVARKAGVSSMVIGLTLVAFATSAPELVVSVCAGLNGQSNISLGNVVGSNICNIALILGLCACISPLPVNKKLFKFDLPVMVIAALLLTLFCCCGAPLGRWQGGIFLAGIIFYTAWNIYSSKKENAGTGSEENETASCKSLFGAFVFVFVGLALLIGGAKLFLEGAVFCAKLLKISDAVIGLTVVAVGTSLPELATSLVAAVKKEQDIAIGNVVGSNIFNILGILGIVPVISPLKNYSINMVDLGTMMAFSLLLLPLMRTQWKISRGEGAVLLLGYIAYTGYLILYHS